MRFERCGGLILPECVGEAVYLTTGGGYDIRMVNPLNVYDHNLFILELRGSLESTERRISRDDLGVAKKVRYLQRDTYNRIVFVRMPSVAE